MSLVSCKAQKQCYECSKPLYHLKTLERNQTRRPVPQILNLSLYYHLVETGRAAEWQEKKAQYVCSSFDNFWKLTVWSLFDYNHCLMIAFKLMMLYYCSILHGKQQPYSLSPPSHSLLPWCFAHVHTHWTQLGAAPS